MTEERAFYDIGKKSMLASDHEHLFRIVFGDQTTIRFCERCGRAWLLSEWRELAHNRTGSCWTEILESDVAQDKSFE